MNFHLQSPAEKAATFVRMADDPRYGMALRRNAAMDAIEDLINFLDETDGDPDLEPFLGAPEIPPQVLLRDTTSRSGWRVNNGSQELWAKGIDAEQDAGEEPEAVSYRGSGEL